jgi:hypothetical protein
MSGGQGLMLLVSYVQEYYFDTNGSSWLCAIEPFINKLLFDPAFIAQVRKYSHKRVIIDINVVKNERMVYLAGLFDEFFHRGLLFLILSVLHV